MTVIRADGLRKSYGDVEALVDMSVSIERGELYGFLGPNGAGKTTTINILTGQLHPDEGTASVLGADPVSEPIETRRRVGILPEKQSPPSFLTPREYLDFVGKLRDLDRSLVEERLDTWAHRLGFSNKLDTLHTDLSRGQQQKVMITQAFVHEPAVVFIDEPLVNLDPLVQEQVKRYLVEYVEEGNTIFVSTHNIDVAEAICTRVGIVIDGELVVERSSDAGPTGSLLELFMEHVEESDARDMPSIEATP
ncbi:MAG: ABC transporter ATP-binding protein [Natrialbaceae archaeon]|nr:ABC transporter ATP-binding protein [Natrialbaceae archaeon]